MLQLECKYLTRILFAFLGSIAIDVTVQIKHYTKKTLSVLH